MSNRTVGDLDFQHDFSIIDLMVFEEIRQVLCLLEFRAQKPLPRISLIDANFQKSQRKSV
jgi:hypothetical protein